MPRRITPLVNDESYHVYNLSIGKTSVFTCADDYHRAIDLLGYYKFVNVPQRFSFYKEKNKDSRSMLMEKMKNEAVLVEILAYCLMSNHFHLVLRQKHDNGISRYLSVFQNSYTRYFNTKYKRKGPIFLTQFQAKRIESEEVLQHVVRYVHLNPYTAYQMKDVKKLEDYKYSSYPDYVNSRESFVSKGMILEGHQSINDFKAFTEDQGSYQRELDLIKKYIKE